MTTSRWLKLFGIPVIISSSSLLTCLVFLLWLLQATVAPSKALSNPSVLPLLQPGQTITLTKSVNPSGIVNPGETLTYTIVFTSNGNTSLVVITDSVPLSTTYQSGSIAGTGTADVTIASDARLGNTIIWTATGVTTNSVVSLTFVVAINPTIDKNVAIINTANLSDTTAIYMATIGVTVSKPDLLISKIANVNVAKVGELITYTYQITNSGNTELTNLILTDDKLGTIPLVDSILSPNGDSTYGITTYRVKGSDLPGPIVNTALISGYLSGGTVVTDSDNEVVYVEPAEVYLPLLSRNHTDLSVRNVNAGNAQVEIRQISDNSLILKCAVPNNTIAFCGSFAASTYNVKVMTLCGTKNMQISFPPGIQTLKVEC